MRPEVDTGYKGERIPISKVGSFMKKNLTRYVDLNTDGKIKMFKSNTAKGTKKNFDQENVTAEV
jgi:hypothetical protein